MMTFDRVLGELLATCEDDPAFKSGGDVDPMLIERALLVRDPRGKTRLVLAPSRALDDVALAALKQRLEASLTTRLEAFFTGPVLSTRDPEAAGKIAHTLLDKADDWTTAAYEDRVRGGAVRPVPGRWKLLERRLTKQGWLDAKEAEEPWPLSAGRPVVTFYSFKGGVGRTTALASCALQLAEQGKRVAAIDLDLEAPGLGPLLGVETERGVLDAIVDHLATDRISLDGMFAPAQAFGSELAAWVDVLPAGRLDEAFLEKLSRLDFSAVGPWGDAETIPVHRALRALLGKVRSELAPDYILLDARAGLHDMAGLSLHGLAHVDILVTRASEQAYRGLDLTVRTLARRKREEKTRCVTVHGFAPADPSSAEGKAEVDEVRSRAYAIFSDHLYGEAPAETDTLTAHYPWQLRRNPLLERFTTISSVLPQLRTEQHAALLDRIIELCAPEDEAERAEG